VRLTKTSKAKL